MRACVSGWLAGWLAGWLGEGGREGGGGGGRERESERVSGERKVWGCAIHYSTSLAHTLSGAQ